MDYDFYNKEFDSSNNVSSLNSRGVNGNSSEIDTLNREIQDLITGRQGTQVDLNGCQQNYQTQHGTLQTQYDSSQGELMELSAILDEVTLEVEGSSGEVISAGEMVNSSSGALNSANSNVTSAQTNVQSAGNEVINTTNQLQASTLGVKNAQTDENKAVNDVKTATGNLTAANKEVEDKTRILNTANQKVESKTKSLDTATKNVKTKNDLLTKANDNVERKTSALSSVTAQVNSAASSLAGATASAASAYATLSSTPQTITRQVKDENGEYKTITENNSAYYSAQTNYNNALLAQQRAQTAYNTALVNQQRAQRELETEVANQQKAQRELETEVANQEKAQRRLEAAISNQEKAQAKLETALENQEKAQGELDDFIATHEITQAELESAMAAKEGAQITHNNALTVQQQAQNVFLGAVQSQESAKREYNSAVQTQQQAQEKYNNALVAQVNAAASRQTLYASVVELSNEMSAQELEYIQQSETLQTAINDYNTSIDDLQTQIEELQALEETDKTNNTDEKDDVNNKDEQIDETALVSDAMISDMVAELERLISEVQADENSKTGLGWAWNGITGIFGGGTKGQLNSYNELLQSCNDLRNCSDSNALEQIQAKYLEVFGKEADIAAIKESIGLTNSLSSDGTFNIGGMEVSQQDIASALLRQAQLLGDNFQETVQSQGWLSKGIGWFNNNILGVGTTQNMTTAQIDNYQNLARQIAQAESPTEVASLYKAMTGDDFSSESLAQLFAGNSKVEGSRAAESMMDYESTNNTIKNTAIAIGTGIAVAATGPLGALAIGAGMSVGINALDAATQNNGKNVGENLVDYAKGDMVKDALVGAVNGLTGKLGNMAGEKLVTTLASRGGAAVEGVAANALKAGLNTGQRILTEFADGAVDAGLSSAAEYLISSAAGKNGNFTSTEGNLIDDNGHLALANNLRENFDAKEMGSQVLMSTLLGGTMSVGIQEGMHFAGKIFTKGFDEGTPEIKESSSPSNVKADNDYPTPESLGLKYPEDGILYYDILNKQLSERQLLDAQYLKSQGVDSNVVSKRLRLGGSNSDATFEEVYQNLLPQERAAADELLNAMKDAGYEDFIKSHPTVFQGMLGTQYRKAGFIDYSKLTPSQYSLIEYAARQVDEGSIKPEYTDAILDRIDMSAPYQLFDYIDTPDNIPENCVEQLFNTYMPKEQCEDIMKKQILPLREFLDTQAIPTDVQVSRVNGYGIFNGCTLNGKDLTEVMKSSNPKNIESVIELFNSGEFGVNYKNFVGTTIYSASNRVPGTNSPILWDLTLPAGTKGAFLESLVPDGHGAIYSEGEFLLQANSFFQITGAEHFDNGWRIHATVLQKAAT